MDKGRVAKVLRAAATALSGGYVTMPKRIDSLDGVVQGWQQRGDKVYDDSMPVMVPTKLLWAIREYTWTRDASRPGYARVGGKSVELPGHLKWDAIANDLDARGWDKKEPMYVDIGRDGGVKVGEGNHRLAIAKKLGIREIPVVFMFKSGKVKKSSNKEEKETDITPRAVKDAVEDQLPKERKKLTEEDDKMVDELMDMLGF